MTLQQLRYIIAIDEYRHFGNAAEANNLTQSTLSLMVKKLEEELDVRIFDRDSHPVEPTEIGRRIIDQAKLVLYHTNQIAEMVRSEKESLTGQVRVAMISTVAPLLVPGLFKHCRMHAPDLSLMTEEMLTSTIKDKLRKAEVEMGIMASPVNDQELLEIPLYSERFFAYVSENETAFAMETITRKTLEQRPLWVMENGLRLLEPTPIQSGNPIAYEQYFEGGRVGILLQIVNENGGMTLIPETHLNFIPQAWKKCIRPIEGPGFKRTIVLAVRKDYIREAALNCIIRSIKSIVPSEMWDSVIRKEYIRL